MWDYTALRLVVSLAFGVKLVSVATLTAIADFRSTRSAADAGAPALARLPRLALDVAQQLGA